MEKLLRHKIHLLTQQPGTCSSSKFSELQRQMIAVTFSIRHQRCIPVSVIVPFWEIHNFWQLKINNVLSNKQLTPAAVWLITSRLLKRRRRVLIGKKKTTRSRWKNNCSTASACLGPIQKSEDEEMWELWKSWRGSIHFSEKWCLEEHEGEEILGMRKHFFFLAHN